MGPVTHPDLVNEVIGQSLERTLHTSSSVDRAAYRAAS
jgi:hypothetical protein